MTGIDTIISFLSIFLVEYQEVKLISELNKIFNFDHNVFLLDSSVDINHFIDTREVIPRSLYVFKKVDGKITGLESVTNITSKNTFMIVVPEGSNFDNNLNLFQQIKKIQKLQINMKIGIFFPHFASMDDLKMLFEWCKEQLIVNVFAASYAYPDAALSVHPDDLLNIFTFHPFGAFEVKNVTDAETYDSYFPSLNSNFQQHELRLGRRFSYPTNEALWLTIFRLMNASFVIVPVSSSSESTEKRIDIIPNLYQILAFMKNLSFHIYPLRMEAQVIVVPEALPYTEFSAYVRTLTSDTFFGYSLITIAAIMLFLSAIRYIKQKKILFFQSVADVLHLLMNDNSFIKYQRLSLAEAVIIVPLTFIGLVIVNGILSNLKSYLTQPVLQPQINTIEEIYRSPFPIVAWNGWKSQLVDALTRTTNHKDWNDKILALKDAEFFEQLQMFNASASFLADQRYSQWVIEIQKRLKIKGFHNPKIQMFNYLVGYHVFYKFLFFERLHEIVLRIQSTGLWDVWWRIDYVGIRNKILERNVERFKDQNKTLVANFEFPMLVVYGWLLSVIVFVIEIVWKNFKLSQMKKLQRIFVKKLRQFLRILRDKFRY